MLLLEGVSKSHGSHPVLSDVTLELPDTGLILMQGKDNRGISALLRIIAGLECPDSGSVTLDGVAYTGTNRQKIRRDMVTLVSTEAVLSEFLRGKDQLELVSGDAEANAEALEALDLAEVSKRRPRKLSPDESLMLSAARGIARSTPVLLVDAPSLAMTESAELRVFGILKALSGTRLVVFVPRLARNAKKQADLIVTLEAGTIRSVDKEWNPVGTDFLDTPERREREKTAMEQGKKRTPILQKTFGPAPLHRERNALKAGWKSIRFRWVWNLLASLVAAGLILFYGIPMAFTAISASRLAYNAYQSQAYDRLVMRFHGRAHETEDQVLTEEKYRDLCEKYGVKGIEYLFMDSNSFAVEPRTAQNDGMSDSIGFYAKNPVASSIVCNNIGLLPEGYVFPLAAGTMPRNGEFLITDYLADRLIAEAGVADYAEILSNGILLPGYPAKVSGIIATDYTQYRIDSYYFDRFGCYSPQSAMWLFEADRHGFYNYAYLYSAIFTPEDSYFHPENGIDCVSFDYGRVFADVRVIPLTGNRKSGCYSNFPYGSDFIKSAIVYGEYLGKDETLSADRPTFFVTEDIFAECIRDIGLYGVGCDAFSLPLTSPEMLDELMQTTASACTPISPYYEDLFLSVQTIKKQAGTVLIGMEILAALWVLLTWGLPLRKHRGTFFSMLSHGYNAGHTILYSLARMSGKILLDSVLILGVGFWGQCKLFAFLQNDRLMTASLPFAVFSKLLTAWGIYVVCLLGIAVLFGLLYGRRNPWGYYRAYAKKHQPK